MENLFKNKVGRPSNEIKRKRKIFVISAVGLSALLLVVIFAVVVNGNLNDNDLAANASSIKDTDNGSGVYQGETLTSSGNSVTLKASYYRGGDVNYDGKLTLDDAKLILKYSSKTATPSELQKKLADVNGKDGITAFDATIVQRMMNGYGDVNKDGKLTGADKLIYYNHVRKGKSMSSSAKKVADINGDGKINDSDYQILSYTDGYQFCVNTKKSSSGCKWKNSPATFSGLKYNTTYYVYEKNIGFGGAVSYKKSFKLSKSSNSSSSSSKNINSNSSGKKTFTLTTNNANGANSVGAKKVSCSTNGSSCNVTLPDFNFKGSMSIYWCKDKACSGGYKVAAGSTYTLTGDEMLYTSRELGSDSKYTQIEDKKVTISNSFTINKVTMEFEKGFASAQKINKIKGDLGVISKRMPFLFNHIGKIIYTTSNTYYGISLLKGTGGITFNGGSKFTIYIPYYAKGSRGTDTELLRNVTIHELAHAWDYYYSSRTGKGTISSQSDFNDNFVTPYYNGKFLERNDSVEVFAAMVSNYYWSYICLKGEHCETPDYAINKKIVSSDVKRANAAFKPIMEKYIRISNNGYK